MASWQRPEGTGPSLLLHGLFSLPEFNLLGQVPN